MTTQAAPTGWDGLLASLETADGLFAVDGAQRIVRWSASAQQLLGYAPEEVLGRPCYEVIGGRDSQNYRFCRRACPIMTNARRGRPTRDYDVLARTRDGADIWVNISILLVKGQGRSPLVLHLMRDVTEQRRVEALARRAMEALRELGAGPERAPEESLDGLRPPPAPTLSRRELQVLQLLACGLGTREIAQHLGVSAITARNHITHVLAKLGAKTRLQAVLYASRRRLI